MARQRRVFVPGASVHVTQRGNNRGRTFSDDDDYQAFLGFLSEAAATWRVQVHSFTLMPNHYHLIVTPENATALPKTVQVFGGRYVEYYNRKYGRTGTLWDGRYKPFIVADDRYFYNCMRYLARNPVEAGIVTSPDAYQWSSYRVHAYGEPTWLVPHALYLALGKTACERQLMYRLLCKGEVATEGSETAVEQPGV